MELFPSNAGGTLVNLLASEMGPASPERDLIGTLLSKSLCMRASETETAVAGVISEDPHLFQDVLSVLTDFLTFHSPIWIEYSAGDIEKYWPNPNLSEEVLDMVSGHCFFQPEDKMDVIGLITVNSKGFTNKTGDSSEMRGAVSIFPYVVYIKKQKLFDAVKSIRARKIDLARGHLHSFQEQDTMEAVTQFFLDCTYASELSGLLIDASIINEWSESEKITYAKAAIQGALKASIMAVSLLVVCQTDDVDLGMPGHFTIAKSNDNRGVLKWVRSKKMFFSAKPWDKSSKVLDVSLSGQVTLKT